MTEPVVVSAPAKLTWSLRVTGVRSDGYHDLDAEFVCLDLADELHLTEGGIGISVSGPYAAGVPTDGTNLVARALALDGATRRNPHRQTHPPRRRVGWRLRRRGCGTPLGRHRRPRPRHPTRCRCALLCARRAGPRPGHRRGRDAARVRGPHRHADRATTRRVDPGRLPGVGCAGRTAERTVPTIWSPPRW